MTAPESDRLRQIESRLNHLCGIRGEVESLHQSAAQQLTETNQFLAIADQVTDALEKLSNDLFQRELDIIQSTLTKALQEILDQPIVFKASAAFRRDMVNVDFSIERNGHTEDIMRGQGGSVANVVSVGLRMFAITTLDERRHRRFLVLDEQDCWLHPDLVPRLVRMVREAGSALGFQVLMISHHDVDNFLRYADCVYRLGPDQGNGVTIEKIQCDTDLMTPDSQ